jgi:fatty acid desaturase
MKRKARGFLGWLVLLLLLWNAGSGILRAVGAWQQRALLPQIGLPVWLPWYLLAAGSLTALLSLGAFISLYARRKHAILLAWVALIVTVSGYWLERLLLWAPEQRGGNVIFMAVLHALSLAALGGYTYRESKMRGEYGSGD